MQRMHVVAVALFVILASVVGVSCAHVSLGSKHPLLRSSKTFPVLNMNYDAPLEELVARGNYSMDMGWSNAIDYTYNKKGLYVFTVTLLQFERPVSGPEVLRYMDAAGFRPATLREVLQFGLEYLSEPQIERIDTAFEDFPNGSRKQVYNVYEKYRIVALGTWYGNGRLTDELGFFLVPCMQRMLDGSRKIYPEDEVVSDDIRIPMKWVYRYGMSEPSNPNKWSTGYYFAAVYE